MNLCGGSWRHKIDARTPYVMRNLFDNPLLVTSKLPTRINLDMHHRKVGYAPLGLGLHTNRAIVVLGLGLGL